MAIKYMGDPHMGRRFMNGVPLHRRGDREAMQFRDLQASLDDVKAGDVHICVGDLYDSHSVSISVVYRVAMMYRSAAERHLQVTYAVLAGNHDLSRDLERISSFQIFAAITHGVVTCVMDEPHTIGDVVLIPWSPSMNAEEMAQLVRPGPTLAVVHNDVVEVGDKPNFLPAATLLSKGITRVVTGHDHLARELEIEGMPVTVTGSLQPYSHSEDPNELIYVTRSLADVLENIDGYKNNCLRVVLTPSEVLDVPIDCLALTLARLEDDGHIEAAQVQFEQFDFAALFSQAVEEIGLPAAMASDVYERLEAERNARS